MGVEVRDRERNGRTGVHLHPETARLLRTREHSQIHLYTDPALFSHPILGWTAPSKAVSVGFFRTTFASGEMASDGLLQGNPGPLLEDRTHRKGHLGRHHRFRGVLDLRPLHHRCSC